MPPVCFAQVYDMYMYAVALAAGASCLSFAVCTYLQLVCVIMSVFMGQRPRSTWGGTDVILCCSCKDRQRVRPERGSVQLLVCLSCQR